jgi:O-antigen/teichoic acid export membrane protein
MNRFRRSVWSSDVVEVVLLARVEYLVIGFFLGDAELGYFAAAIVFAGLVTQLTMQLSPAFVVGLTQRAGPDADPASSASLYRNSFRLTALFVMPLGIGGAGVIASFLPLVFGEDFRPGANAAVMFMVASVPAGLAVVPWAYLAAHAQGTKLLRLTLTLSAVILTLLVLVVPGAGITGAALVRVFAEFLLLALLIATVAGTGGPNAPWRDLMRILVASLLLGATAHGFTMLLPGLAGVLVGLTAGAVLFLVGVRLLPVLTPEEASRVAGMVEGLLPASARPACRLILRLVLGTF